MVRTPSYDKYGLKKGTWTPEEDKKLSDYVTKYGFWNWRQLPKYAGLARCGKSCRLRWMNYLRPDIKRGNYSKEEEDIIIRLHDKLGNSWSAIAAQLPGRMDNEIKNHWHSYLKKKLIPKTTSNEINPEDNLSQCTVACHSSQQPQMDFSSIPTDCNLMVEDFSETLDDFWSEQLLLESPLMLDDDFPSAASGGMASPLHSTALFDGEQLGQYDDLFSSF